MQVDFEQHLDALEPEMSGLLEELIAFRSVSGSERPLTQRVAEWGRRAGLEVDLWEAVDSDIDSVQPAVGRHLPLAGRPVLVLRLPGTGMGRSLMLNAHSDVVPAGDVTKWTTDPWRARNADGLVFGRGACDMLGGLVSGLWVLGAYCRAGVRPAGDLMLELVPGEEDCVGVGTLASIMRGWDADACVVLEPTESTPRCASRGGLRFEIVISGRSVHGTVKWLGRDAILGAREVLEALEQIEGEFGRDEPDGLFASQPILRPVTVDTVRGGEWQGMVCDRCIVAGYLELLPGDDLDRWQSRFRERVKALSPKADVEVNFTERYNGHRTKPESELCRVAEISMGAVKGFEWHGFNSGCESGVRANLMSTPTLVWGPGSLAQAHTPNEFVPWNEIRLVARGLYQLSQAWCSEPTGGTRGVLTSKRGVHQALTQGNEL